MDRIKQAVAIAFSATLAAGLAGCDRGSDGTTVGQKVDRANEQAKVKLAEIKKDIKEATADVKQEVKEATPGVKQEIKEATATVKEATGDALITSKVKTALIKEPGLSALKIDVDTANGIVTLSGTVDSIDKSSRARELATAVEGVTSVDNRLIVGRTG